MKPLIKKMFWLPPKTIEQIEKEVVRLNILRKKKEEKTKKKEKKISGSALLLHIINNWFSK